MSRFMDFLAGTVECCVKNGAVERFFNLCKSRDIVLENIRENNGIIYFSIKLSHFWQLRPVVKKCRVVPHICRRKGLPFLIRKHRRQAGFLAGILLACVLLAFLSGFIWNIEFYGNYGHTEETLIAFLKEMGVHTGQFKGHVDLDDLEDELRLAFDDISWVSARIDGTVLKIQIKEGLVLTPDEEKDVPGNVVALQDGIVSSIVTRSGTAMVQAGDRVFAGDVLISGTVDIYNDDETIRETRFVHGDGDVYLQTVYHCEDYYPATYVKKHYTGREKTQVQAELFGHLFAFGNGLAGKETSLPSDPAGNAAENTGILYRETATTVTKYRLTPNFYLPVRLYTIKSKTYTKEICTYTREEMEILGREAIEKKLEDFSDENIQILSQDLTVEITEEYYRILGDIHMIVPGGSFEPYGS